MCLVFRQHRDLTVNICWTKCDIGEQFVLSPPLQILGTRPRPRDLRPWSTLWTKNTKMLSHIVHKAHNSDKIWYTLSWINLRSSSLNIFQLTSIMPLHYLVKLSVVFYMWTAIATGTPKNTKCFCHIIYKTRPILIKCCTYCPEYICQSIMSVFHLT